MSHLGQTGIRIASAGLRGAIRAYQLLLSPVLGNNCRYHPSCSHYAIEAVDAHGPLKGGWLALRRIARCHPWGGMGYDPVPAPHDGGPAHHHHHHRAGATPGGDA